MRITPRYPRLIFVQELQEIQQEGRLMSNMRRQQQQLAMANIHFVHPFKNT
jgi:hypothetical protein